jgi:thiamine biosynthesis lipoprotein
VPHRISGDASSVITVAHSAVSTSGDAVQYVDIGDTRYSHVINPQTGLGLTDQPTTTVVAPEGLVADAVATTVGILGVEKGRSFVRSYHPGMTVYATGTDSTHVLQRS